MNHFMSKGWFFGDGFAGGRTGFAARQAGWIEKPVFPQVAGNENIPLNEKIASEIRYERN